MSGWFDTIWADDLPSRAVTVYMYLRSRADREGKCFPSVRTISRDTKLSMSTVRRALDDLVNTGYIQKQPRWRANGRRQPRWPLMTTETAEYGIERIQSAESTLWRGAAQ